MNAVDIQCNSIKFDLMERAISRMLSQWHNSYNLKLLLRAFTDEIQELSTALEQLIEYRTLKKAQGEQLEAIGRIVGRPREYYEYETNYWFTPDTDTSQPDNSRWWCYPAPQATSQEMDDDTYRKWLWMQILENHNLYSSTPELEKNIQDGIDEVVGIQRTGMMEADLYVSNNISLTNKKLLIYNVNSKVTDNDYLFPYPATTKIDLVE